MGKSITDWMDDIEEWAKAKGWWDEDLQNVSEKLMLIVTEVAEAMEETRNPDVMENGYRHTYPSGHLGTTYSEKVDFDNLVEQGGKPRKPEGFGIELADIVIRVFHLAAVLKIDLEQLIALKLKYNRTRPRRHGGRLA